MTLLPVSESLSHVTLVLGSVEELHHSAAVALSKSAVVIVLTFALAGGPIHVASQVPDAPPSGHVAPVLEGISRQMLSPRETYWKTLSPHANGNVSIIIVLVEFSDVKHAASKDAVSHLIFTQMADYYRQVSYGALEVVGNVTQWITLNRAMSYYGEDTGGSIDPDSSRLVVDAVAAIEPTIDLSQYQSVVVMHAGTGQESEPGKTSYIWSVYYDDLTILTKAGLRITAAEIVPESEGTDGLTTCLGVVAHEFAHSLGLPDLYDEKSLDDRDYVGPWSLMSKGTWLGHPKGSAPSELEAYGRNLLGWLPIQEMKQATSVYLSPLETWNGTRAVRISAPETDMYYLVEVRRWIGYDVSLPEEGVLITQVRPTRESGLGILKVVDGDSSDTKLNHAPFHDGNTYGDEVHGIYFTVSAQGRGFIVTLSPAPIVYTTVVPSTAIVAYGSFATFAGHVDSAKLTTPHGLTVVVSYLNDSTWMPIGSGATDWQGVASFRLPVNIPPGQYRLLYSFAGTVADGRFLWPSNATTTLIVTQGALRISVSTKELYAVQTQTIKAKATDEFNRPVANLSVSFFVNDQLIGRSNTNPSGYASITSAFGLWNVGNQNLLIEVDGGRNYVSGTTSMTVAIVLPDWFYNTASAVLLMVGIIGVLGAIRSKGNRIGRAANDIVGAFASRRAGLPRIKYCIYCGQPILIDARFCTNIRCGLPQVTP